MKLYESGHVIGAIYIPYEEISDETMNSYKKTILVCCQDGEERYIMKQDILFAQEDFIFSYRVAGILIHDDKILLQRPKRDNYSIIGGHIKCMETSEETLRREYKEEIKAEIELDNLMAVGEIFFNWGNRPCHQICLYYKIHLSDLNSIPLEGTFQGYDDWGNERMDLDFCWIPIKELKNGLIVYPLELIPHILNGTENVVHFISKQL